MTTNSVAMWETRPNNADWDCFKTPILQEILKTQNRPQGEFCAHLDVVRLFQSVRCVRNKLLFRRVQQTKLACILEADESTRMRMGNSIPHHHEDHIAGKGENSIQHYNLVHKFIPMPQAMKIPAAKAAVDKEWEKLEKISAWNLTKVKSKKQVIDEARMSGATVHFASLMDICHLKNAELEAKHQKYKGRVVLRGDIVKDNSGSYAVFTEQGSSASQMTAAKVMDIISRWPGCAGQAADAVSVCTQVKMEDAPKLLKIPKSECPDIWIRLPRHKWPKSWSSMEETVVPLERNLYGHPLAGLLWERQFEKILLKHG